MNNNKKFDFYVGVLRRDINRIMDFINLLNEDSDPNYRVFVKNQYDDPDGYYNLVVNGSWQSYKCFLDESKSQEYIKSLEHYEES
jgi:hypothetical protein